MSWNLIPDADLKRISDGMEQAECAGLFDGLFSGVCKELRQLPTKEGLLENIHPNMKLYRSFFMRIYGYEISYPGFSEIALSKLEMAGCSRAREYYTCTATEFEFNYEKGLKDAARWYMGHLKEGDVNWNQNREPEREEMELLEKELALLLMKKSQR